MAFRLPSAGLLLAASLPMLAACGGLDNSLPPINRYASINLQGKNASATTVAASATMIVFDGLSVAIPSSALQQGNGCVIADNDTTTLVTQGQRRAGTTVALTAEGSTIELAYNTQFARYATPANSPFTYTGGGNALVTIPGDANGFPASNIGVKLVEPILPGPITLPAAGQPMTVTWNGINDPSAAIIVQLRYADPATSTYANAQLYCALSDDGSHTIAASELVGFLASPAARRSVRFVRWRTNQSAPNDRAILHIVSSVDTIIVNP